MAGKGHQILIVVLCLAASCVKDKPPVAHSSVPGITQGVYVLCEGQYPLPDAGLYLYKPATDSVFGELYAAANGGAQLGEVLQSITHMGSRYFLAVNNSDKITVIDTATLQVTNTIGIRQPRYILPVDGSRAYVSTLFSNKVYVINTGSYAIADSFVLPTGNAERMCMVDGFAYLCSWDTAAACIYKVNTTDNSVVQTIPLAGRASHDIVVDKNNTLWVLSGDEPYGYTATLTHIFPATGEVLGTYTFGATADPIKLTMNGAADTLYYIDADLAGTASASSGVFRMPITSAVLPSSPFIAAGALQYYWALGVDPVSGLIYVGDPHGFNQKGTVTVYSNEGTALHTFQVGIGPGSFYFAN